MKTVRGVKMIEDNDILNAAGNRTPMCSHLKQLYSYKADFLAEIDEENKIIIDTNRPGDTVINVLKAYRLVFVPLEVVQERLFVHMINNTMKLYKEIILDNAQRNRAEEVTDKYEKLYESIASHYRSFDDIYGTTCVLFIFDGDNLEDIVLAHPPMVVEQVLRKKVEYKCAQCGHIELMDNKSFETFLPSMRYRVVGDKIEYFCKQCVAQDIKLQRLKHVGE